jgi:hypothetical protein
MKVGTHMDRLKLRGTKRHCQSDACGKPFYDLGRTEIACPECGSAFVPPPPQAEAPPRRPYGGRSRFAGPQPAVASVPAEALEVEDAAADELPEAVGGEELLEVEEEGDEVIVEPPADGRVDE